MIRGWVYVIINPAMPALVKIGYSTKDPVFRARELNNTGNPHPYSVAYDALLSNPRDVEQSIHKVLSEKQEGKEWFRLTVAEAITAIRAFAGKEILLENINHIESHEHISVVNNDSPLLQCNTPGCSLNAERIYKEKHYCVWHFRERTNPKNIAAIRLLREEQEKLNTKFEK